VVLRPVLAPSDNQTLQLLLKAMWLWFRTWRINREKREENLIILIMKINPS